MLRIGQKWPRQTLIFLKNKTIRKTYCFMKFMYLFDASHRTSECNAFTEVSTNQSVATLNFLINEHARLTFLEKKYTIPSFFLVAYQNFSTIFANFQMIINEKIFPPYSFILVCSFTREFRVTFLFSSLPPFCAKNGTLEVKFYYLTFYSIL